MKETRDSQQQRRVMSRRAVLRSAAVLGSAAATGMLPVATSAAHPHELPDLDFGPDIESLGPHDPFDGCIGENQVGVVAFKDFLHQHYQDRGWGIRRSCDAGFGAPRSLHKEGRALDWMRFAAWPDEEAEANEVIGWLLASDRHGHEFAMARRLGITQVIWNRRIWTSYRPWWRPYWAYGGHVDHIHFSFNWAGALMETSFWRLV